MKAIATVGAIILAVGLGAVAQFHYAFYYDLSGGQDLEINLMNTMPWPNEIVIEVHDAYGGLIWDSSGTMDGYATAYVRLGENISSSDYTWGVVTVGSTDRVIVGLEYFKDALLVSMDTVYDELPTIDASEPYWLGTYYTQVGDANTSFIVMNPWETTARCAVTAYDADGASVYSQEFVLGPYESEYVSLGGEIGTGGLLYGLLDMRMEGQLVVLALEYTGRGRSGLEIDNVTEYYF
jgi:hypothetical protein